MTLTGLLISLGLVNAEDPAPFIHKTINISPSAPNSAWPVELPQKASATVTVNVAETGTVNKVNYKLKAGYRPDYSIDPSGGAVIWKNTKGKKGDTTFEFHVVNATTTTSVKTNVNVFCLWESDKNTTGSSGGKVSTAPDINGLAMAMASLQITGSCAWSFNRTTQLADGLGEIDYRLALVNAQGQIQTTPFTNVEAAAAAWTFSATAGPSPLVGNVKSSTPSNGYSQASYNEQGTTTAKKCVSVTELVFWNLEHNVEQVAKKDQTLTRVKLGLSERVHFRLSPTSTVGNWSIITGNGFLKTRSGWATLFTAPPTAQDVVTRVEVDGIFKDLTFKIVAPADVVATGVVKYLRQVHTFTEYDCDAEIEVEYLPTDVSFYRVRASEQDGTITEAGDWLNAPWHPAKKHTGYGLKYIPADNTTTDHIRGGIDGMNQQVAWPNGSYTWHIPMDYQADSGSLVANWKSFDQVHTTSAVNDGECEIVITKFGPKSRVSNY